MFPHSHCDTLFLTCPILTYITLSLTCTLSTYMQSTHIVYILSQPCHNHSFTLIPAIFVYRPNWSSLLKVILWRVLIRVLLVLCLLFDLFLPPSVFSCVLSSWLNMSCIFPIFIRQFLFLSFFLSLFIFSNLISSSGWVSLTHFRVISSSLFSSLCLVKMIFFFF